MPPNLTAADFFAGCGLATEGLKHHFHTTWANDICPKKARSYCANFPADVFHQAPIETLRGADIPSPVLAWASFPCQDLSLAGAQRGLGGARSGLVWEWLRVLDEMDRRPPLIVAENVPGLMSAGHGQHYAPLHAALVDRGYRVGALLINAAHWVAQSRPRVFIVGVRARDDTQPFEAAGPHWAHPDAVRRAAAACEDWVWWNLPEPHTPRPHLDDIVDFSMNTYDADTSVRALALIPARHRARLEDMRAAGRRAFPGYKRMRHGRQVLELRFDGLAGCLRTPEGGSSRQFLVVHRDEGLTARLLSIPEAARLMGAPPTFRLLGGYNDRYKALGDGVAVPVVRYLADHLLAPLARRVH